jgi:hypothetical protein
VSQPPLAAPFRCTLFSRRPGSCQPWHAATFTLQRWLLNWPLILCPSRYSCSASHDAARMCYSEVLHYYPFCGLYRRYRDVHFSSAI